MIPLVLFALAFLVRLVVGAFVFQGPAYPDAYYYAHVAAQIAAGHGLISGYVWNLDDVVNLGSAAAVLPTPANGYWMPLAELVAAPFVALFGTGSIASGLAFWLIGALAAPLTYWIGRDAGLTKELAAVAGVLVAVPAGLTPFVAQPDTFALFMFLGPLALWLCAKAARGDRRFLVASGVVVGLAMLARLDGALLGIPVALVAIRDVLRTRDRSTLMAALACVAVFLLIVAPWAVRQVDTFGSISPSAVSGRALWLTNYQQLFSISQPPTMDQWLSQGIGWIASSRIGGLIAALGLFALLPLAAVLAPFAAIGGWQERHNVVFGPYLIYGAVLLMVMALLFPILVPHGTFIHSAASLVPHTFLLTVVGIGAVVRWFARKRPAWNAGTAVRVFSWSAVAVAVIAAVVQTSSTTSAWSQARTRQTDLVASLASEPATDRFMAADPGAINYLTGTQGVVTPDDPLPVIEQVMSDYDVRWLVLESDQIVPALEPVLSGADKPDWISRPLKIVQSQPGAAPSVVPDGALFAVCLSPSDTRCQ